MSVCHSVCLSVHRGHCTGPWPTRFCTGSCLLYRATAPSIEDSGPDPTCSNLFILDLTVQGTTLTCSYETLLYRDNRDTFKLIHLGPLCTESSLSQIHSTLFTVRKVVGWHLTKMPSYFFTFISGFPNETSGRNRQ